MVVVNIKTAGSVRKHKLEVPDDTKIDQLRGLVSSTTGLPESQLSLVLRGKPLLPADPSKPLDLQENDTIFATVKPPQPPAHVNQRKGLAATEDEDAGEDDDLKVEIPVSASDLQNRTARFLRQRLHCPDLLLVVFFWFHPRTWLVILLWFCMAPLVQYYFELGPIYVLGTCFALIFFNLGTRQQGEASAYSIFNEGFRELPGTLNADRLDNDIRAGQF